MCINMHDLHIIGFEVQWINEVLLIFHTCLVLYCLQIIGFHWSDLNNMILSTLRSFPSFTNIRLGSCLFDSFEQVVYFICSHSNQSLKTFGIYNSTCSPPSIPLIDLSPMSSLKHLCLSTTDLNEIIYWLLLHKHVCIHISMLEIDISPFTDARRVSKLIKVIGPSFHFMSCWISVSLSFQCHAPPQPLVNCTFYRLGYPKY
jgi:hypothetical protein